MRATVSAVLLLLCVTGCATTPGHPQPPSFDPELTGFPYPFEVHEYALQSQGQKLQMAYMDERPDPWNGQTVLLLHGKNFAGFYWQPTMRALLGRGFRVVVPDQVCFGKSTKTGHYQFSFSQLATNTMALLHSIGVARPIVVGHAMGGMLAARFAPKATPESIREYQRQSYDAGQWKPEYEKLITFAAG